MIHQLSLGIAMLEKRVDESEPALTRYVYSNHLQSASLELDQNAAIISYEEYHPYGTTAFQVKNTTINAVAKRYRYTGKERDEESGLYYHGARYYIPWLCRWTAIDPINIENYNLAKGYGLEKNKGRSYLELTASPYEYSYDNPIAFSDPSGEHPPKKQGRKESEYIVKKNETLSEIALKHQTTVQNLVKWNQLRDENYIQTGQHLIVNSKMKLKSMYGRPEENFIDNPLTKYNNKKQPGNVQRPKWDGRRKNTINYLYT